MTDDKKLRVQPVGNDAPDAGTNTVIGGYKFLSTEEKKRVDKQIRKWKRAKKDGQIKLSDLIDLSD